MTWLIVIALGLAHGIADGSAGMQLGVLARTLSVREVGSLVLVYNMLAFGSQPLVGLCFDRLGRPRVAAVGGIALHCAALLASTHNPSLGVTLAGLGSAAFHVGGGAIASSTTEGKTVGPGLFAGPGVIGLALGGALAVSGHSNIWPFLLPLAVCGALLIALPIPRMATDEAYAEPLIEGHDVVMLVLLTGIALRSAVWTTFQFVFAGRYDLLLAMACAAAVGKIVGGVLADRVGWRRWALGALLISVPLLMAGQQSLLLLLPGVALLQSATPICLAATARLLPRYPATAAGLVLGLAVAIGGIPAMIGMNALLAIPGVIAGATLVAALALWWVLPRQEPAVPRPSIPAASSP